MSFLSLHLDFLHNWILCFSLMFRAMLIVWLMVLQNKVRIEVVNIWPDSDLLGLFTP